MSTALTVFVLLALAGVPIGLVMIGAGLTGAVTIGGLDYLEIISDRFFAGVSGFVLIAIPYFIFTAELMNRAGMTDRLVAFANSLFGRVPGALSHVNVTVSVFFAGITGAAVTDTVAIGRILIPAMKREGYAANYSAAVTACSSIIGPIIPPSIIMIVYAATIGRISVIGLFAAGLIPGLMMAGALLAISGWLSWRRGFMRHETPSLRRVWRTGLSAFPALFIPVVILAGILSGATTVTEAAAIGAAYTFTLGVLAYRTIGWRELWRALVSTVSFSGVVFFLLGASTVLGWFVTRSGVARDAAEFIATLSAEPAVQILAVDALLLVVGMFIDVLPAVVVMAPVLAPAMAQLGFDSLHFAIVMLLALNIGNITPPVGMTLMTASRIARIPYESAVMASLPFLGAHLAVLVLASVSPELVLWFPKLIGALR
ncbi:MAG: TRAP transporter large permease [Gammaproteobacteria bacterium]|nr:TRAP transporter large permease [Gammaproteobacteria bacterium]NIR83925.1 TRAP transporter large permease [Gammaproteobacteria bacterium]NIR88920.1 TRAP transporter large permease [Gammaproteobacteria bacterium]NIU04136.1 TRAP transporter large permease [Gammaproteobacteria bacterium]NIV74151.1 TRAP transporter large permease subunit [Gammaproteobacteria bacterium]